MIIDEAKQMAMLVHANVVRMHGVALDVPPVNVQYVHIEGTRNYSAYSFTQLCNFFKDFFFRFLKSFTRE